MDDHSPDAEQGRSKQDKINVGKAEIQWHESNIQEQPRIVLSPLEFIESRTVEGTSNITQQTSQPPPNIVHRLWHTLWHTPAESKGVAVNIMMVLLTVILALFAYNQWRAAKEAVAVAEKQWQVAKDALDDARESSEETNRQNAKMLEANQKLAEAAKQFAEAGWKSATMAQEAIGQANEQFRQDQRPRIKLTNLGTPECVNIRNDAQDCQIIWTWHFTNVGKTPANAIRYIETLKIKRANDAKPLICENSKWGAPVAINTDQFSTALCRDKISRREFENLLNMHEGITVSGRISYQDDHKKKYETGFCLHRLNTGAISYCAGNYLK